MTLTGAAHPPEHPGAAIGPYKLPEPIGEGGMGTVYMAQQTEPVRRKVALKIIKPGMDTRQFIARFEAERQALAMMDHPNIARVLDAGATGSGRPFFVMELVRGIPITGYCDREQLSIPERLTLFVLVCRAIQHAHQKGVIHRDLRPSNVLVTVIDGAAVPEVIDFGIAKATGGSLTERTLYTGFAQLIGTPLSMSPEQADLSGVDVDTRSDIYSLGVLLYELLTGTTPFDQESLCKVALDEMRRIIREVEPPRPSTRLSSPSASLSTASANRKAAPRQLIQAVRGEPDWVVMRAMEKDRRRRYETASDFAADVLNDLADRPVEACPTSARHRFSKYARRHRAGLATAGLASPQALVPRTVISQPFLPKRSVPMNRPCLKYRPMSSRPRPKFRPDAEGLEGRQLLSAGALDPSFGTGGYTLAGPLSAQAVQIQPLNGDILAAGEVYPTSTGGDFRVVALTPSGALDPSFGFGGSVATDFAGKEDRPQAMAVMPDGRIVVAGWADTGTGKVKGLPVTNYDFAVARYLPGGSLDTSFGTGGKVTTNISTYGTTDTFNKRDEANAVVIQDDGKIVVGGYSYTAQGTTEGVLVRYNTDGTLDTSFGQGGVVQINLLPNFTSDGVWGLAIWRDPTTGADEIVTMEAPRTSGGYSVAVARYNPDGSLDAGFGTNGRTVTTVPGASLGDWGMALQSDGSVVVTGYYQYTNGAPQDTFLLRYTAAGVLDSTFGNNGITVFDAGGSDIGYSVAIQPGDGKILVAGSSSSTNGSAYVARFQADGTIDTTFGSNGEALNAFANSGSSFHGLAVQSDGKIVAVGGATSTSGKTTTNNFLIARFLGDTTTLTAAASPLASASTGPAPNDTSLLISLAPPTDQDLTALATGLIGAGKKQSRTSTLS